MHDDNNSNTRSKTAEKKKQKIMSTSLTEAFDFFAIINNNIQL